MLTKLLFGHRKVKNQNIRLTIRSLKCLNDDLQMSPIGHFQFVMEKKD